MILTDDAKPARLRWRKGKISSWMRKHNVELPDDWPPALEHAMTKADIYGLARINKPKARYVAQDVAKKCGVEISILPDGDPELRPIEMVWRQIKRKCATKSLNFKLRGAEKLAHAKVAALTPDMSKRHGDLVIAIEGECMKLLEAE